MKIMGLPDALVDCTADVPAPAPTPAPAAPAPSPVAVAAAAGGDAEPPAPGDSAAAPSVMVNKSSLRCVNGQVLNCEGGTLSDAGGTAPSYLRFCTVLHSNSRR